MGLFSDYLNGTQYINLATSLEKEMQQRKNISRPKTVDSQSYLNRYTRDTIRELYLKDWFTFSTVNFCTNTYSRPPFKIIVTNQKGLNEWNTFFESMTQYGTNTSVRRLRSELKRDSVAYGCGYLEYVYNTENTRILDLKRVDSSTIEHAKDRKGKLILNRLGLSIGYVLHLGTDKDPESKGDVIPFEYQDMIQMNNGDIFIKPDRIAEFPLIKLGNDTEAIGLVEPAILQAQRRIKLETAQVNALWIRGTSPLFTYVGDPTHEPTPQMMEDAVDAITELRSSAAMAFPYYNKVDAIDIKMDSSMENVMNSLMFGQAGASSTPLPFVTSQGEATNRATLATQKEMFESNIQSFIDNFDEDWNTQVMTKVAEVNGLKPAKIVSERINLGDKLEFSQRITAYLDKLLISTKEARDALFRYEDIQRDDVSYETEKKEKEKIATQIQKSNTNMESIKAKNNETQKKIKSATDTEVDNKN
jgi:hypothetical protein